MFVPMVGGLILLVMMLLPSQRRVNAWGEPRGIARAAGPGRAGPGRANAFQSYALLQADAQPSPEEIARRKEEVHAYFVRNVSRRAAS